MERYGPLVGRILLAAIFLMSGLNKILHSQATQQYMASAGMPATGLLLVGAIVFELAGAVLLVVGWKTRIGAWLLIIFLVPTTLIFHTHLSDQNQVIHFMKNLSMLGGLLYVAAYGPGPLSIEQKGVAPAPR